MSGYYTRMPFYLDNLKLTKYHPLPMLYLKEYLHVPFSSNIFTLALGGFSYAHVVKPLLHFAPLPNLPFTYLLFYCTSPSSPSTSSEVTIAEHVQSKCSLPTVLAWQESLRSCPLNMSFFSALFASLLCWLGGRYKNRAAYLSSFSSVLFSV